MSFPQPTEEEKTCPCGHVAAQHSAIGCLSRATHAHGGRCHCLNTEQGVQRGPRPVK